MRDDRSDPKRNRLVVEGAVDLHAVVGLMRAFVEWPQDKKDAPVRIECANGVDEILRPAYLSTLLKSPEIGALGVLMDADREPRKRYTGFLERCSALFPDLPKELPENGLIATNEDGKRLGVWIMPDNRSLGNLETFLRILVPDQQTHVWEYAVRVVGEARRFGATCDATQIDKANLYTWLAWSDQPGQSPGLALTRKVLDPRAPGAAAFVGWFRELFEV